MEQRDAERLHDGLRRSFAELFRVIEDASLQDRAGYRVVVCPRVPFPGLNGIWAEGPENSTVVHEIEGVVDEVEKRGVPCWIQVRAGRTPAIEREARRLGFSHEDVIPGMVMRPADLVVTPGPDLEITQARDAAGLAVVANLAAAGFEVPREQVAALFTPHVAATPGVSIYVARADGKPVSTATSWVGDGGVGIYNVATPPEHRSRGYGRAITAKAVEEGFASGADLAWLQASPLGEPVYRAMGFRQVETYLLLGRAAPG